MQQEKPLIKKSKSTQTTLTLLDVDKMMSVASITYSDGDDGPNEEDKKVEEDDDYNDASDMEIEEPTLSDDDMGLLHEEALFLIDEFIKSNPLLFSNPDFETIVYDHVQSILHFSINYRRYDDDNAFDNDDQDCSEDENETVMSCQIDELINVAMHDYFKFIRPHRSYKYSFIRKSLNLEKMKKKIEFLESLYQPEQKTEEWYSHRHGLITASSVWKAFGSPSVQNQLIYEKCMPFDPTKYSRVNTESSLHWGQKYEVLSKQLYEEINGTKVQEFGCIRHPNSNYYFIGASPDGINVCPLSPLYGRLVEIKNVVSREINGIPKEDYWIQMQIQMEVCNLPECDFEETKFTEY